MKHKMLAKSWAILFIAKSLSSLYPVLFMLMLFQRSLWKPFFFLLFLLTSACQQQPAEKTQSANAAAASSESLAADTVTLTAEPPSDKPVTWHRLTRRTNPNAPLLVYSRVSRPPASELVASPPPRETRLFDLTRKASQYYRIDPTHPAEVRGQEGTVVRIPAGCFVDGRQRAVEGQVWIELKECYSLVDMLLSDMVSETADGQLLTTGGGVFIRASAHGQQLALAPNRTYQVELPVSRQQAGMSLFRGISAELQPVRWEETAPADPAPEQIYTTAEQLPTYGKSPTDINKLIRYPKTALARGTQGMVFASFVVDEAGRIRSPKILRGIGDGCDEEVLRVLRQTSGHWTPGQQDGRFVKVKMVVPIRFNPQEGMLTTSDTALASAPTDTVEEAEEGLTSAEHYVFRTNNLGWLLCARPHSASSPSAELAVRLDADPNTSVRLVLADGRTVLSGVPNETGSYVFRHAPAQPKGTLVAVRYFNDTPYLALRQTDSASDTTQLKFEETTLAQLETALRRLE